MYITVAHKQLKETLELTARISTKHLTLPTLQCVLLNASNGSLTISATNLEIGIEGTLSATVKTEGKVAVSATTLLQTINLITQKEVTLEVKDDVLTVSTKSATTDINTVPTSEFPSIPHLSEKGQQVNGPVFAQGIKTTAFAASQSSIKPELGSVYLRQKKEHSLTFVATDSFRLTEKTVPQQGFTLSDPILIPQKNAIELARVCEYMDENPTLIINENQCALQFESIYITSRLTTGTFPDYTQIIPKEFMTHVTVLTSDFSHALKKTNIFLNKFMQVTVRVARDTLTLSAQSGEVGKTEESVHATVEGEEIQLNFNQRYLTEVLPYIVDDSITLHFAGIGRPLVIESVHDTSLTYLVMPMNK